MSPPIVVLDVLGAPAPKGSARAFVNKRTGRAILAPSGSKQNHERLASWGAAVRLAAHAKLGDARAPRFVDAALEVCVYFRLARPAGHWGTGKRAGALKPGAPRRPRSKPDVDKLVRTTLDALTGIVFDDDSRIVRLVAEKRYAAPGREGAEIAIGEFVGEGP